MKFIVLAEGQQPQPPEAPATDAPPEEKPAEQPADAQPAVPEHAEDEKKSQIYDLVSQLTGLKATITKTLKQGVEGEDANALDDCTSAIDLAVHHLLDFAGDSAPAEAAPAEETPAPVVEEGGMEPNTPEQEPVVSRIGGRYSRFDQCKGTISFPNRTAKAIWDHEILGQMSDGAFENSQPQDHWQYWSALTSQIGEPKVVANMAPNKTGYNFEKEVIPYVGDRMIQYGKMASVTDDENAIAAADSLPATYEEYVKVKDAPAHAYLQKYYDAVPLELAEKFYASKYSEKNLKMDIMLIKRAMATREIKY